LASGCFLLVSFTLENQRQSQKGTGDLTEYRITLDRRVLDWAVGLDSEINELVEGSDLYEPKVVIINFFAT
jgi:hypothetical protein